MTSENNIKWYMYKYLKINNLQIYLYRLLLALNVPLRIRQMYLWRYMYPRLETPTLVNKNARSYLTIFISLCLGLIR